MGAGRRAERPSAADEAMSVAIVTGAGRGIGRAITLRLMADGYTVVGCGRSARADDFPSGAQWVQASVAKPEGAADIVRAAGELGDIALLVNNVGVQVVKTVTD